MDSAVPDPYREQLDARWSAYLRVRAADTDHADWMGEALANHRDEIVHFGAQLLNDVAIRSWDERSAARAFEQYQDARRSYDADPEGWERSFWRGVRDSLPPALRARWRDPSSPVAGDRSTPAPDAPEGAAEP